jgi:hypothetical protein
MATGAVLLGSFIDLGCSSGDGTMPKCPETCSPAAGGSGTGIGVGGSSAGAGGSMPMGGMAAVGGSATGGIPGAAGSTPAGQLMCGGKLCKGGGHCAADGTCPAFLGSCFTTTDNFSTCDAYCSAQGFTCAAKACNADGTAISNGYSSVSYSAADRPKCQMSAFPDQNSFDACTSPIWLSPTKPLDDVVRCCCKD